MKQGDLLRAAREVLGMTLSEFAGALGVSTRRMYNWLAKPHSSEFRGLHEDIRVKLDDLLEERFPRGPATGDWLKQAPSLLSSLEARDHVRTNWNLAAGLVNRFLDTERRAFSLYGDPIAKYLSEGEESLEAASALEYVANELQDALQRSPSAFSDDQRDRATELLQKFHQRLADLRNQAVRPD